MTMMKRPTQSSTGGKMMLGLGIAALLFAAALLTTSSFTSVWSPWGFHLVSNSLDRASSTSVRRRSHSVVVLVHSESLVARKKMRELEQAHALHLLALTTNQQQEYLETHEDVCSEDASTRFRQFRQASQTLMAHEVWKYCALAVNQGGLYLDADSPLVISIPDLLSSTDKNIAVTSNYFGNHDDSSVITHASILSIQPHSVKVAQHMLQILIHSPLEQVLSQPLLVHQQLMTLIRQAQPNAWFLYQHSCLSQAPRTVPGRKLASFSPEQHESLAHYCPLTSGYCCQIQHPQTYQVVMMTRHPVLPNQVITKSTIPTPLNALSSAQDASMALDLPYISTLQQTVHAKPKDYALTPNFFDTLLQNNCLPSDLSCSVCLRDKKGANCDKCRDVCPCYCKTLCHVTVETKFRAKTITVFPPRYSRDATRLVPRIVHQTWFENVSKEKYPNMSRLIQSFQQSGWEYKFYTDEVARHMLEVHFPPEVVETYDTLKPGAFKADLFRYCILLIYGGVYSDMDVLLESNLDVAIAPDVGFVVPVDEPGTPVNKRMCLWNGFIAAAPGHPFLAEAIETVVNNVRNRFTSVDVDATFCPDPELSILHAFDTLFSAGPCLLGSVVNKVLGRHGQTQFEAGTITPINKNVVLPGRTVILHQNKWDMGAHRFTWLERNLVVAATDMPDYDDRDQQDGTKEHYSKTHVKTGIYGLEKLYTDNFKANEDVHFVVQNK
jgi:mannosyltransferase OCH1-like enzyme